jgi:hypothetical protein
MVVVVVLLALVVVVALVVDVEVQIGGQFEGTYCRFRVQLQVDCTVTSHVTLALTPEYSDTVTDVAWGEATFSCLCFPLISLSLGCYKKARSPR